MKNFYLIALTASLCLGFQAEAGSGAHGGDGIKLLFSKARLRVVKLLQDPEFASKMAFDTHPDTKRWILENQEAFLRDVMETPHQWGERENQEHCGLTDLRAAAPISFSIDTCRKSTFDLKTAMEIVAHESVHHFDIADEDFCDAVALAIASTDFDPAILKTGVWMTGNAANVCVGSFRQSTAVSTGKKLVVMRTDADRISNTTTKVCFAVYDVQTETWEELPFDSQWTSWIGGGLLFAIDEDRILGYSYAYSHGSEDPQLHSRSVWEFSLSKGKIKALPLPPIRFATFPSIQLFGDELVYSARIGRQPLVLQIYNLTDESWTNIPVDFQSSTSPVLTVTDKYFLVVETYGYPNSFQRFKTYDREKKEWHVQEFPSLQNVQSYSYQLVWDGQAFLYFNGIHGIRYFPDSKQWTPITRPPTLLDKQTLAWTGKHLVLVGQNDFSEKDGFLYDLTTKRWRSTSREDAQTWSGAAIWIEDRLLFLGLNAQRITIEQFFPVNQ